MCIFITGISQGWYFISSRVRRCVGNIVRVQALEKKCLRIKVLKKTSHCRSVFPNPTRDVCATRDSSFYTKHSTLHSLVTGRKLKILSYDHSAYL